MLYTIIYGRRNYKLARETCFQKLFIVLMVSVTVLRFSTFSREIAACEMKFVYTLSIFSQNTIERSIMEAVYMKCACIEAMSKFFSKCGIDLLAILQKSLDRALFLYNFIREVRSNGVRGSITIMHI